jgi:hypothetical protein
MQAHDFEYQYGGDWMDGQWHLLGSNLYIQDTLKYLGYYSVYRDDTETDETITVLAETYTLGEAMQIARKEAQQ